MVKVVNIKYLKSPAIFSMGYNFDMRYIDNEIWLDMFNLRSIL